MGDGSRSDNRGVQTGEQFELIEYIATFESARIFVIATAMSSANQATNTIVPTCQVDFYGRSGGMRFIKLEGTVDPGHAGRKASDDPSTIHTLRKAMMSTLGMSAIPYAEGLPEEMTRADIEDTRHAEPL